MRALEQGSDVRVVYDVPSRLPALLASGEAQAILVSSIEAFRMPGAKVVEGVCIGSRKAVKSVRLFSKVPFAQISRLALDASSMTSNELALMVLRATYGVVPACQTAEPSLEGMLQSADAAVLIGDIGMTSDGSGLHVLDLGEAWFAMTGLPFVWAVWIGRESLNVELADLLRDSGTTKVSTDTISEAVSKWNWSVDTMASYYQDTMAFEMAADLKEGFTRWQAELGVSSQPIQFV